MRLSLSIVYGVSEKIWREAQAWSAIRKGWRQLFGSFRSKGLSFEWHHFENDEELDWARSFHPDSVEICLNLSGTGVVEHESEEVVYAGECGGFYCQGATPLRGKRARGKHEFLTVEYSREFLRRHFSEYRNDLHPLIAQFISRGLSGSGIASPGRLRTEHTELIGSLQNPRVHTRAQSIWFECKALELATAFFLFA